MGRSRSRSRDRRRYDDSDDDKKKYKASKKKDRSKGRSRSRERSRERYGRGYERKDSDDERAYSHSPEGRVPYGRVEPAAERGSEGTRGFSGGATRHQYAGGNSSGGYGHRPQQQFQSQYPNYPPPPSQQQQHGGQYSNQHPYSPPNTGYGGAQGYPSPPGPPPSHTTHQPYSQYPPTHAQHQPPYGQQPPYNPQHQAYGQQQPQYPQHQSYGQQQYPPPPGPVPAGNVPPAHVYGQSAPQGPLGAYAPSPQKPVSQGYQPTYHAQNVAPQSGTQAYNPATYDQETRIQPPPSPVQYNEGQYTMPAAYQGDEDTSFHGYPDPPSGQVRPPSKPTGSTDAEGGKKKRGSGLLGSLASGLTSGLHTAARKYFPATSSHIPYQPGGIGGGIGGDAGELHTDNRYDSFAPPRISNGVKWYVEGRDYMHAVSVAIEHAKESIWIMDWWLSPELYLRRPPAQNEGYRLDRMLQAAAQRGVSVRIMVYKEVAQVLTLDSHHTKKALEGLHENISVLRHPDHVPDATNIASTFAQKFSDGYQAGDFLKSIYGIKDGKVLYWAHHEKLVLIDGLDVFMGGLDLCFGRWDVNDHPIADAHPDDVRKTIWPGQDYNNSRVMDFHNVDKYTENNLSRLEHPRMGWTDVAISFQGPTVQDFKQHFVERWNFIHELKYKIRNNKRYPRLELTPWPFENDGLGYKRPQSREGHQLPWEKFGHGEHRDRLKHKLQQKVMGGGWTDGVKIQALRSASKWSHGTETTEHSICNAYIDTILNAQYFIYIENQFFITATCDKQNPILNQIGAAIVQRIVRAHEERTPFRIIICIPAVPGFAGDLKDEGSLGTRAIIEFQFRSINNDRGYSIMEQLASKGIRAEDYISFYNLRNYDRINTTTSNVSQFDQANQAFAQQAGAAGYGGYPGGPGHGVNPSQYAPHNSGTWDSVSSCKMLNGPDLRTAPWTGTPEEELNAFVSEELYIHSKLLIADDRTVIIGSANINDRSQLGDHDSEIAVIIEDPTPLRSRMAGREFTASNFAATLRRQIFRKHLGLIPAQNLRNVDENCLPFPAPNLYDFRSKADALVTDPLDNYFWDYWQSTAHRNTEAFRKVFHAVPDDTVTSWEEYDKFYYQHFRPEVKDKEGKVTQTAGPNKVNHVCTASVKDVREVKEILAGVRGHLVHMPLRFLCKEDIAVEGVGLNAFTETIYT